MLSLDQAQTFNILAFLENNKIVNENQSRIEFYDHYFLRDIYLDYTPEQVVMKCAQIGYSTTAILKAIHLARYRKANVIYTLPSRSIVKDFVSPKVDPLIVSNPVISQMVGKTDSTALKSIGDRFIYFRGSWEELAAISISAHVLINDELDRSNQRVITTYRSRLDEAKRTRPDLGFVWQFSNPSIPGTGVDEKWQISDQKHWFIKCFEENTVVLAKINNPNVGVTIISMKRLYNLCKEPENLIDKCFIKYPQNIFIFSKNGWTKLNRIVKSKIRETN